MFSFYPLRPDLAPTRTEAELQAGLTTRLLTERLLDRRPVDREITSMCVELSEHLVMPEEPALYAMDQPITAHGTYFDPQTGKLHRVVSLSYDKGKDNADGVPRGQAGPRRVIAVTNVSQRQTHEWQRPTTYISGALLGHINMDGIFIPTSATEVPINHYSRMCTRGEVPDDQRLSADPPTA